MGSSRTYHIVSANEGPIYGAMSSVEKAQLERRWGRREWRAQTLTGERILQAQAPKLIPCVCEYRGCPACNFSGITTRAILKRYQPWQLERFATAR